MRRVYRYRLHVRSGIKRGEEQTAGARRSQAPVIRLQRRRFHLTNLSNADAASSLAFEDFVDGDEKTHRVQRPMRRPAGFSLRLLRPATNLAWPTHTQLTRHMPEEL